MQKWYKMIRSCGTAVLISTMFCLTGCQNADDVGEETGEALEEAGEAARDATEEVGDTLQDAADEVDDAF